MILMAVVARLSPLKPTLNGLKQMKLNLSHQTGNIKLTGLDVWQPTFPQLCRAFSTPKIDTDKLNAGYFLRCAGTKRGNETVADTADLLILDGDKRIDIDGNIVDGTVNPLVVHLLLNYLNLNHFIYTSHSNEGFHMAKCDVMPFWKYRVLIPVTYTRHQLPALLDWIFKRLHENEIMLVNAKENAAYAQAWFMPCIPMERAHLFQTWWRVGGVSLDKTDVSEWFEPSEPFDVERIYSEWLAKQQNVTPVNNSITTLSTTTPTISENPIIEFNRCFSVEMILERNGYKRIGQRYLHPNSASKMPAIEIVLGRKTPFYIAKIFTSSDILCGDNDPTYRDAFDCYRILECGGNRGVALNWNADLTKANQRAFYEPKNTALDNVDITPFLQKIAQAVAA